MKHSRKQFLPVLVLLVILALYFLIFNCLPWEFKYKILLLLFLSPAFLLSFGKVANQIIDAISEVALTPLLGLDVMEYSNRRERFKIYFRIYTYYVAFSYLVIFLIHNSLLTTIPGIDIEGVQLCILALVISIIPRIYKITKGSEYSKALLISILTPLTLAAIPALFVSPSDIQLGSTFEYGCVLLLAVAFVTVGDITIELFTKAGIIKLDLDAEAILAFPLEDSIKNEPVKFGYSKPFDIWWVAAIQNREEILRKIGNALAYACKIAQENNNSNVRLTLILELRTILRLHKYVDGYLEELIRCLVADKEYQYRYNMAKALIRHYDEFSKSIKDLVPPLLESLAIDVTEDEEKAEIAKGIAILYVNMPPSTRMALETLIKNNDINTQFKIIEFIIAIDGEFHEQVKKIVISQINHFTLEGDDKTRTMTFRLVESMCRKYPDQIAILLPPILIKLEKCKFKSISRDYPAEILCKYYRELPELSEKLLQSLIFDEKGDIEFGVLNVIMKNYDIISDTLKKNVMNIIPTIIDSKQPDRQSEIICFFVAHYEKFLPSVQARLLLTMQFEKCFRDHTSKRISVCFAKNYEKFPQKYQDDYIRYLDTYWRILFTSFGGDAQFISEYMRTKGFDEREFLELVAIMYPKINQNSLKEWINNALGVCTVGDYALDIKFKAIDILIMYIDQLPANLKGLLAQELHSLVKDGSKESCRYIFRVLKEYSKFPEELKTLLLSMVKALAQNEDPHIWYKLMEFIGTHYNILPSDIKNLRIKP